MEDFWRSTKIIHSKRVCCGEYRSLILAILMLLLFSVHRKAIHVRKKTNFQKYRMKLFRKMKFLRKSLGSDTFILIPIFWLRRPKTYCGFTAKLILVQHPLWIRKLPSVTCIVNGSVECYAGFWYLQNVPLETMLTSR